MIQQLPACLFAVAQYYSQPPVILDAIVAVETGRSASQAAEPGVGVIGVNKDGTRDHGPGQINDRWLKDLQARTGLSRDQLTKRLDGDYCYNVGIVGYILSSKIAQAGGDFWTGVGWYHSMTPALAQEYRVKILRKAVALYGPQVVSVQPARHK